MNLRWLRRPTLAPRVAMPHVAFWAITSGFLLALGFAALLIGRDLAVPLAGVVLRFPSRFDPSLAAALIGVLAVIPIRRFLYARLARRPGPIEISSFSGHPPLQSGVRQSDLLAEFRRTLTEMSLSAPEPVPSEPTTQNVVDDVRTAFDNNRGPFVTALLVAVSLLRVRHAYRVSVQVLSTTDSRCGLSVHTARLPSGRGEVETVWEEDWMTAAQRAAHVVGAYLVPRSRLSRRAPWLAWHGLDMPTDLFHHSQRAARFIRERRYERALEALHDALEGDPQNPYLRIDLGQVQEQAGLHLDAAATYADVIAVESWFDGRLWRRLRQVLGDSTTGAPPTRLTRKRNGRDALLIARYRMAARLGAADQLADQWSRQPDDRNGRRHADRGALKIRLRVWLNSYARLYEQNDPWVPGRDDLSPEQDRVRAYENDDVNLRFVHLIQFVGRHEAEALADDYRWSRGRRVPGLAISQTAVQLLRLAAVLHERRAWLDLARYQLGKPDLEWDNQGWLPLSPRGLDARIGRRLYLKPGIARSWKEYYNAACITAIVLPLARGPVDRTMFALQAVRHLERAVSSTDSGYVSRYAQWLSTGDHDLDALRSTDQFVDFLDRYLPNREPRVPRPESQLLKLVMSHHTARLLASYCERRVEFWTRYDAGLVVSQAGAAELERERSAAAVVSEYVTHDRHWQTRMLLISEGDDFCRRAGLAAVQDVFPNFQEDPAVEWIADNKDELREVRRNPDRYFREQVIAAREEALTVLTTLVNSRCTALSVATPEPEACKLFWSEIAQILRRALGSDERRHVGTSRVAPLDATALRTLDDPPPSTS